MFQQQHCRSAAGWQRLDYDRSSGLFFNGAAAHRSGCGFLHLNLKTSSLSAPIAAMPEKPESSAALRAVDAAQRKHRHVHAARDQPRARRRQRRRARMAVGGKDRRQQYRIGMRRMQHGARANGPLAVISQPGFTARQCAASCARASGKCRPSAPMRAPARDRPRSAGSGRAPGRWTQLQRQCAARVLASRARMITRLPVRQGPRRADGSGRRRSSVISASPPALRRARRPC